MAQIYQFRPQVIRDEQPQPRTLRGGDGGGTYDGMDAWQTSVEGRLGQLHDDIHRLDERVAGRFDTTDRKIDNRFFWLLGIFGGGVVLLLGALVTGYFRLDDAITHVSAAISTLHH